MRLFTLNTCIDKNNRDIYFDLTYFNGLYRYNIVDNQIYYVTSFEKESTVQDFLYEKIYVYNDNIFMIPNNANNIGIYNKITGEKKYIKWEFSKIYKSFLLNDCIWIFTENGNVLYFSVSGFKICVSEELTKVFSDTIKGKKIKNYQPYSYDGRLILCGNQEIIVFKIKTKQCIIRDIPKDIDFFSCFFDGSHYWLQSKSGLDLYRWDEKKNSYTKYKNLENEDGWGNCIKIIPYSDVISVNENILLAVNYYSRNILIVDETNKTLHKLFNYPESFTEQKGLGYGPVFSSAYVYDNKVLFMPFRGDSIVIYDIVSRKIEYKKFYFEDKKIVPFYMNKISNRILDNNFFSLNEYVEFLKGEKKYAK